MPDLLKYLKMKKSGELAQKRLDNKLNPSMYCVKEEVEPKGDTQCK